VAEGIEEHAEANILHKFGCHIGQGYMYSRPLPLVQFFDLFNKNNKPTPIQDISLDWDLYKYLAS
jgi:EAL domain-containing protein (putative c-di-GMP-specific phosphodiesterase class I)